MIGKGGMGVVWAGTNERTGKRVALKILRRAFDSNSEAAQLFRREASVASRVNHPNVVTVFDIIDHEQMTCIVMEFLNGEPLNEYLAREGPVSMERAAALLLPAMRGVAAANAQGVIHRDLKPHNIFLCVGPDGRLVTAKVLDFGNSLLMESTPGSPIEAGQLAAIGTPAYMAPENIAGSTHYDERVDVYGFGVVLYEALAGQHPFPGPPEPELLSRIMHEQPPPLASLCPDVPPDVIGIIERAMAKDPAERFPNLNPFIRLLEDHVLPVTPLPRSMTPLAGVPVKPLVEPHSGIADAFVQVRRRVEASQVHETRVLYSRNDVSPPEERKDTDQVPPDKPPTQAPSRRNVLGKPVLHTLLFTGLIAFVVWIAFPMPAGKNAPKAASPTPSPAATPTLPQPGRDGPPALDLGQPSATDAVPAEVGQLAQVPDAGAPAPDDTPSAKRLPNEQRAPREARRSPRRPDRTADMQAATVLPADAAQPSQPAVPPSLAPPPFSAPDSAPPPSSAPTPLPSIDGQRAPRGSQDSN